MNWPKVISDNYLKRIVSSIPGICRWQTETGGVAISPRPSEKGGQIIPGKPMRPLFGVQPVLLDDKVNYRES